MENPNKDPIALTLEAGERLDVSLAKALSMSRSAITKEIKAGRVTSKGIVLDKASLVLKGETEVLYTPLPPVKNEVLKPKEKVTIDYVYRDDDIAVINKERGMVVHPAPGHYDDTLVNYLASEDEKFDFDSEEKETLRPGIVHRIDKDTQGLLCVAENAESQSVLQNEIREHDFHREYFALVYGNVLDRKFRIDVPLTRPNHSDHKAEVDPIKGRKAVTHCELVSTNGQVSLLKCSLETGRTHQIRAHLAYIGFPIVGDPLYCPRKERMANKGQALTAFKLTLIHPRTLKKMTFYAPLDSYFKKLLMFYFGPKK